MKHCTQLFTSMLIIISFLSDASLRQSVSNFALVKRLWQFLDMRKNESKGLKRVDRSTSSASFWSPLHTRAGLGLWVARAINGCGTIHTSEQFFSTVSGVEELKEMERGRRAHLFFYDYSWKELTGRSTVRQLIRDTDLYNIDSRACWKTSRATLVTWVDSACQTSKTGR